MNIEVKTGLFDYTPGELTLAAGRLYLCFGDNRLTIPADNLRTLTFSSGIGDACRLELATVAEQIEIFISQKEDVDTLVAAIYELAREAGRVELRMDDRSR